VGYRKGKSIKEKALINNKYHATYLRDIYYFGGILMKIAIQQGLESLKTELEKRGHEVFYIGENKMADAVLYKEVDTYPYYEVNNVPSAAVSSVSGNTAYGALLLNVTNKSIDEILRILDRRTYSPLL